MNRYQNLLLAISSGALLALSFPPMPLFALAFVAFVPLLFMFERGARHPYVLTYITFLIYHLGANWWVSSWSADTDPYLVASGLVLDFVHPLFFMVPVFASRYIGNKMGSQAGLWSLPFLWVAFEWLHSLGDLAYPWLTIGQTQIYNHYWVQIADLAGVWGVSFMIMFINVLVFSLIIRISELITGGKIIRKLFADARSRILLAVLTLSIVAPVIYGGIRCAGYSNENLLAENKTYKIGIVQPNINPWSKWDSEPVAQIKKHFAIQDSLIRAAGEPDLMIWSETAILYISPDFNVTHNFSFFRHYLDSNLTPLLSGFADFVVYPSRDSAPQLAKHWQTGGEYYESYNSAIMLNFRDSVQPFQVYHKMKLTPFAERFPYAGYFSSLVSTFEWGVGISGWAVGKHQKNLTLRRANDSTEIAPVICIESIFPGFVAGFVRKGASIMAIITNDGWYDHTPGPEQHFTIAQMRAIENRRYLVRCANTGVSGCISPTGETLMRLPEYKATGGVATVAALRTMTVYTILGDWLGYASLIISILMLIYSIITGILRRKKKLLW